MYYTFKELQIYPVQILLIFVYFSYLYSRKFYSFYRFYTLIFTEKKFVYSNIFPYLCIRNLTIVKLLSNIILN